MFPPYACALAVLLGSLAGASAQELHSAVPAVACRPAAGMCPGLAAAIAVITAEAAVSRAHWGVMVTTLEGSPIASLNGTQFFRPASNAKLYTTAAAMALLGPEHRDTTRIEAQGIVGPDGTTLTGDLVLVGGGEANLSGRSVPYVTPALRPKPVPGAAPPDPLAALTGMADTVAATGLRTVHGDVVGDDTLYPWDPYPSDWTVDDTVWYYGAPVSALTVNDNQIDVTVIPTTPGARPAVTVLPALPAFYTLDLSGLTTGPTKSESHVGFDLPLGSRVLRIYGTIAAGAAPQTEGIAIQDPAEFAALALKGMLEARGIHVDGRALPRHRVAADALPFLRRVQSGSNLAALAAPAPVCSPTEPRAESGTLLASHQSEPLADDVTVTNKVSQNLHAELLLLKLGATFPCAGVPPVSDRVRGAAMVHDFLVGRAGVDAGDFVFYDGSGLSGHDLVTPRATARLLQYAATQPWFAEWKASLPVGGEDGSLAARFGKSPVKDRLWAKTGTLGESRALSGYLQGASGQTVIFSVMVDTHTPSSGADGKAMDRIVELIAASL